MAEFYDSESGLYLINDTGISNTEVVSAIGEQHPHFERQMNQLAQAVSQNFSQRTGNIFERDRYVTPQEIYEQIKLASHAAKYDDVVSGVLETTEAMAFERITFECEDPDEEELWNQIAEEINLDMVLRQMWREDFVLSQFYTATWMARKTFKMQKNAKSRARRKRFNIVAPRAITILDPLRVVPVGEFVHGRENLAYVADRNEAAKYDEELAAENSSDLTVRMLFRGRYKPDRREAELIRKLGFKADNLFLLNPDIVHRHTDTRATYERFADIRMASIFELLDMKNLLRSMDRANLLGSINYIVLVRIGSDDHPAKQDEVSMMGSAVRQGSRLPVLIGDHRLQVDIISPDNSETLRPERYNTIDSRITSRLYSLLVSGEYSAGKGSDKSLELSRIIGRVLESRRHMLKRYIERTVIKPTFERNDELTCMPNLRFAPRRISLFIDPSTLTALMDLRDRGEVSRSTILGELGLSQENEAQKIQRERSEFDEIFQTHVPHDSPQNQSDPDADPRSGGRRRGGSRNGGGRPPGSGDSAKPRNEDEQ